jgi:hypothetical protein
MLGGAFSGTRNYMPQQLQGAITNGKTQIQVPYNNFGMFVSTVEQGAAMLDSYLKSGTGQMVAFGHSLGAVVCSYWIANYGPDSTIDPADLSFVFIGNSVSPYGGALGPESGALWNNWFTTAVNFPTSAPWAVADIKRQYDGWTDWATGTFNFDAEFNGFAGQGAVHPSYENVNPDPNADGNVSHVVGNVTYVWSQTTPVPIYGTTWNPTIAGLDEAIRPTIESGHNRPVTIPSPSYA